MKKFEIINNSLVVTDTVTSKILLDAPKGDVYYDSVSLDLSTPKIKIIDLSANSLTAFLFECPLSEAVDSGLVAFNDTTIKSFARNNLGFKTATGGSVAYDNSTSGLSATNVQGAIDELDTSLGLKVSSDVTGITGAGQIINFVKITQAAYNALGSYNASTFYAING